MRPVPGWAETSEPTPVVPSCQRRLPPTNARLFNVRVGSVAWIGFLIADWTAHGRRGCWVRRGLRGHRRGRRFMRGSRRCDDGRRLLGRLRRYVCGRRTTRGAQHGRRPYGRDWRAGSGRRRTRSDGLGHGRGGDMSRARGRLLINRIRLTCDGYRDRRTRNDRLIRVVRVRRLRCGLNRDRAGVQGGSERQAETSNAVGHSYL